MSLIPRTRGGARGGLLVGFIGYSPCCRVTNWVPIFGDWSMTRVYVQYKRYEVFDVRVEWLCMWSTWNQLSGTRNNIPSAINHHLCIDWSLSLDLCSVHDACPCSCVKSMMTNMPRHAMIPHTLHTDPLYRIKTQQCNRHRHNKLLFTTVRQCHKASIVTPILPPP